VVRHVLYNAKGVEAASSQATLNLKAKADGETTLELTLTSPEVWSLEQPNLYKLVSYVLVDGQEVDCEANTVGIRTLLYTADKGFLLNGKQVKMKGVNLHHDAGAMGAAVPERVWERRIEILKSGGCNAIRTAHNPPAPELLDLCDEMGFLVMDEAFDEWLLTKFKSAEYGYSSNFAYGYGQFFTENAEADLVTMIRRDREPPLRDHVEHGQRN